MYVSIHGVRHWRPCASFVLDSMTGEIYYTLFDVTVRKTGRVLFDFRPAPLGLAAKKNIIGRVFCLGMAILFCALYQVRMGVRGL